jgi:hypothetical protein
VFLEGLPRRNKTECARLEAELGRAEQVDVKTLTAGAGVTRAALYTTYLHLKEEFESRRDRQREAGEIADPRIVQIERLKEFRTRAVSQLAAQHDEITRLRRAVASKDNVHSLPGNRAGDSAQPVIRNNE